ncbi:hypothetical protein VrSk94_02900 [Vibrio rotiferianus]
MRTNDEVKEIFLTVSSNPVISKRQPVEPVAALTICPSVSIFNMDAAEANSSPYNRMMYSE